MADVHSKETRSYNMSRIRSAHTKPEMIVRKFLHGQGFRYRLHDKKVFGKPDMVLKKLNTVIFVHGCYFHRHKNCHYASEPKTNKAFWKKKFEDNVKRDKLVKKTLRKDGWRIIEIWECEVKGKKVESALKKLVLKLN
jgi:DNA mismatch endonuclease (patch repair protein)